MRYSVTELDVFQSTAKVSNARLSCSDFYTKFHVSFDFYEEVENAFLQQQRTGFQMYSIENSRFLQLFNGEASEGRYMKQHLKMTFSNTSQQTLLNQPPIARCLEAALWPCFGGWLSLGFSVSLLSISFLKLLFQGAFPFFLLFLPLPLLIIPHYIHRHLCDSHLSLPEYTFLLSAFTDAKQADLSGNIHSRSPCIS